ncbi:hypothetical protein C4D60_Mb05t22450 [Musa balbisiana]|uniref:TLDc domain-containing protein n=1 Tax=Musa balbisiana TaxID=52838 RepID=A0A4S8JY25_MUSBA|nr:hypothetical protein C4D60_Mb05t22450 [Musa balbisiana]
MPLWKDKVAGKLSRLLAETPSAPSPRPVDSAVATPEPQEIGSQEFVSPKRSFFSRFLSLLNPASCGIDASERKSPTYSYGGSSSSRRRRKVKFFSQKDRSPNCIEESVTRSESEAVSEGSKRNMDHFSDNPNGSHILDKASTSHDSAEYLCYLTDKSVFMSAILFEFFGSCLPNIVKGCQWILLYRAAHGNMEYHFTRFCVTVLTFQIVGDMQGAVFGGFFDGPLKPAPKMKYQGTTQTFVFTTIYGEPRLFRATGANRYYYLCLNDVLAFGGGGSFALSLDEDLLHGISGPCETFGNLCLAHSPEFELKNVELWGFAHSSQYLT